MSTVNLGCKLDLKTIALRARNAEYNPKVPGGERGGEAVCVHCIVSVVGVACSLQRFAAVIMRIRDPRTTALIFSSGKMVCTGAKRCVWWHTASGQATTT